MLALPSPHPQWVTDGEDALRLADYVLSDERTKPLLIITCRNDTGKPGIDPDIVAALTGDTLDIAVCVPDAAVDDAFNARVNGIPDAGDIRTAPNAAASYGVYNGAIRLYPAHSGLSPHPGAHDAAAEAPLYYADTHAQREHMLEDLTARLVDAGLLRRTPRSDAISHAAARLDERDRRANDIPETENRNPAHVIQSADQVRELTDLLRSSGRMMPIVVVAQSVDSTQPFVDADLISNTLHDLALVAVLHSDEAVVEFKRRMPRPSWVFGNAGRVFPTGTAWDRPDTPPRLFLPNKHVSRMLLTNLMMKDALINVADTLRELSAMR